MKDNVDATKTGVAKAHCNKSLSKKTMRSGPRPFRSEMQTSSSGSSYGKKNFQVRVTKKEHHHKKPK
jgi:hypothetical protein